MRRMFLLWITVVLISCDSKENKRPSIYEGNINVGIDESIRQVIEAETDAYANRYKGATFNNYIMPENQAVKYLLEDSMDVICIGRTLNAEELAILAKREITYKPAPMALDAVVLITNHEFLGAEVSLKQLKELFTSEDSKRKLVFDSGNSANLNLVLEKLGIQDFNRKNVVSAGGSENVFEWVKKDRNAIGFVGFNHISEKASKESQALKKSVKILNVKDKVDAVYPEKSTILRQTYPFHRTIYLHTIGTAWGVENGFIRFACTKPGQLIAEKMGLVPYYAIPKQFVLSNEPL